MGAERRDSQIRGAADREIEKKGSEEDVTEEGADDRHRERAHADVDAKNRTPTSSAPITTIEKSSVTPGSVKQLTRMASTSAAREKRRRYSFDGRISS